MKSGLAVFLALLVPAEIALLSVASNRRPDVVQTIRGVASANERDREIDSTQVDRFVAETLRRSGIPGAGLAIVQGDRILHTAGYGRNADGTPVTPDTVMAIASLSKSFTAVAVMQLVAQGAVSLDAPAGQYLPEFQPDDSRATRITVRQLLNHSSGLTFESLPGANVRGRPPLHRSLDERVAWLSGATLRAEPGSQTTYDNFGYEILARLVERVSGQPFADYLREAVFAPLGMDATRSFLTTRDAVTVPPGHTVMFGIPVPWQMPPDLVAGAGGVASSANDLGRWLIFHTTGRSITGRELLPADAMAQMHAASAPGADYGFGWRQGRLEDGTTYYHHSGRMVTYAAHEALFPARHAAYAFVTNGLDPIPAGGAALIAGLTALVNGRTPAPAGYSAAVLDHVVLVSTAFALTIGIVGVARSRMWALRQRSRPLLRAILRCLPYVAMLAAVVFVRLMTVPWRVWWETWPPFAVAYPIVAAAATSIVAFRAARLTALRLRRVDDGDGAEV